jgi:predicted metalloprotease
MKRSSTMDGGARQEAASAERGGMTDYAARGAGIAVAGLAIGAAVWFGAGVDPGDLAFLDTGHRMAGGTAAETAMSATAQARRMGAIHAEAEAFWMRALGPGWTPAEPVFFSGSMPSPCAGRGGVAGHFRCAADRVAGYDLVLAAETEQWLREVADTGQALLVGRIVAGATLEGKAAAGRDAAHRGDCLAGVWSASALGAVEPGLYARALIATRRSMESLEVGGPDAPAVLNDLAQGDPGARDAAFMTGAASGDPEICAAF